MVFCYHAVPAHQVNLFRRQMDFLQGESQVLPADARTNLEAGKRHCMITFDDGFRSVLENALPILKERNLPAAIFCATGYFGATPDWIQEPNHPDRKERIMTEEELKTLDNGTIIIGSHTVSHPFLHRLSPEEISREFEASRQTLEKLTTQPVTLLAIPFGKYPPEVFTLARQAGYSRVLTNDPEQIEQLQDRFVLGRFDVSPTTWRLELRLILAGAYRWLPHAFRWKKRVLQGLGFSAARKEERVESRVITSLEPRNRF